MIKRDSAIVLPEEEEGVDENYDQDVETGSLPCDAEKVDSFDLDLQPRKGTIPGTVFNTVNTIIGAGVLGLPFAIGQVGWVGGVVLLILGAVLTWYGLHLLTAVAKEKGGDQNTFGSLAEMNVWFPLVVDVLVWILMFAVAVLYIGTAADFLVPVAQYFAPDAGDVWYTSRTFYLTLSWLCFGVPLSIPRKMTILQYTSGLAILCVLFAAIVVAVYTTLPVDQLCEHFLVQNNASQCFGENCCVSELPGAVCCIGVKEAINPNFGAFFSSFPVLVVSFCCAPQVLALFNDLKRPTVRRMDTATGLALLLCSVLYFIIGLCGYFTYGANVSSDLLGSYPLNLTVSMVRLAVAFVVSVSFPLLINITRDTTLHMFTSIYKLVKKEEFGSPLSKQYRILYYIVLAVILVASYLLGLLGLNMTFLLNLGGSLSAANLSFTLPGLYYWYYMRHEGLTAKRLSCIFMMVFGILIMVVNIVLWIKQG